MMSGFITVNQLNRKHPALSHDRKRHRKHKRRSSKKNELQTVVYTVVGFHSSEEFLAQDPVGPASLKELIDLAITSLYGEEGRREMLTYRIIEFNNKTGQASVEVTAYDVGTFTSALALMPSEDGRLRAQLQEPDETNSAT